MFSKKYNIILSLVFTLTFALTAHGLDDNWLHWERGLQQIQNGMHHLAKAEFGYYLRHPEMHRHMFGIAYFGRALVFEDEKEFDLAIIEYELAIKNDLHPTVKISTKAYMNMGTIYMKNKKYKEAIKVYLKAIEIKPNNGLSHYFLGLAYFESGDYGNAEKQAIEAKELGVKYSALSDKLKKVKSSSSKKTKKE